VHRLEVLRSGGEVADTGRAIADAGRQLEDAHVARRRQLESLVATGQVACCRCSQLIEAGQPWHLDHRDDRSGYLGPSHATCNLRAAAEKTNGKRKDQPLIWSRVWFEPIPPNVILSGNAAADGTHLF